MKTVALVSLLVFAPLAAADEIEIDLTGQKTDGTIVTGSFDINTATAVLDPTFITFSGHQYIVEMTATFDFTNYHLSTGFSIPAGESGVYLLSESPVYQGPGLPPPALRTTDEFFMGPGPFMFHTSLPAFTMAQFNALNDPFAAMLMGAYWNGPNAIGSAPVSFASGPDGGGLDGQDYTYYYGIARDLTTASVPEPLPLALFPLGLAFLWVNRRRTPEESHRQC